MPGGSSRHRVAESSTRRLEWTRPARAAYEATLARIAEADVDTASRLEMRVARSLSLLQSQPGMGSPSALVGRRVYPIPNTGHNVSYRVTRHAITIVRWYRQRQNVPR